MAAICKKNKFSHCRFGRFCHFTHQNQKCFDKTCDANNCDLRHPQMCRNILQSQVCKFGSACSFEHSVEGASEETLTKEMEKLICLLKQKDEQIKNLELKIKQIEGETIFDKMDSDLDTVSDSSIIDVKNYINEFLTEEVSTNSSEIESYPSYQCEKCDFKTEHERGLKVHVTRKHKLACENCDQLFEDKQHLQKHLKVEEVYKNIEDKNDEQSDFELKIHRADQACFIVSSETNPRDDKLPVLYLHCSDCWTQSSDSCQDLPEAEEKENVILNNEFYNPTLHAMLEWAVIGDITMQGCYLDWPKVKQMIDENMGANSA